MAHVDGAMICPECGCSSYLIVDGQEMTKYDLLHPTHVPKSIQRHLPHALWCSLGRAGLSNIQGGPNGLQRET